MKKADGFTGGPLPGHWREAGSPCVRPGKSLLIGVTEEDTRLRAWYESQGFVQMGDGAYPPICPLLSGTCGALRRPLWIRLSRQDKNPVCSLMKGGRRGFLFYSSIIRTLVLSYPMARCIRHFQFSIAFAGCISHRQK